MANHDQYLREIDRVMSRMGRRFATALSGEGLSGPQYIMLQEIASSDNCHPSDLAQTFGITLSAVTATVNRMARDGLVWRTDDEMNRRHVVLTITDKGRQLMDQTEAFRLKVVQETFGKLTSDELAVFVKLVYKIADME